MRIAVIGSTRIASIHISALLKCRIEKIFTISRQIKKAKDFLTKYDYSDCKNVIAADYKVLDKYKFDLIIVCVNTNYHHDCIERIKKRSTPIFVEKPLISINSIGKNYEHLIKEIYKKYKNLVVNYPMKYFAQSIKKVCKFDKRIKKIEINYITNGKHVFQDIRDDLLPHALSFVYEFFKHRKKFEIKRIEQKSNKNFWQGKIYYNQVECIFNFKEIKIKQSKLYLRINNKKINRITKIHNGEFINAIDFEKNLFSIKNPMHQSIRMAIKNRFNRSWIKKNSNLTKKFLKINYLFSL